MVFTKNGAQTIRLALALLVVSMRLGVNLSAEQPSESALRTSMGREAIRLGSSLTPSSDRADSAAVQAEQAGDWGNVVRLKAGRLVRVITRQGRSTMGRLGTVGADIVQVLPRRGPSVWVPRGEVWEVRLSHDGGMSVRGYVGLGVLLGGLTGYIAGAAAAPCQSCGERGLYTFGGLVYGIWWGGMGGFVTGEVVHHLPERLVYARRRS